MNGKNIVKYRKDNGISQLELAKRLGIAKTTLWRWEQGKTVPHGEEYARLASIVDKDYLVDEDLSEPTKAVQAIEDVSDKVENILYQVSRMEAKQSTFEDEKTRAIIRHKRIQSSAVIVTCLLILALVFCTWLYWMNHGFTGEVKEGPVEIGQPSYFTVDDDVATYSIGDYENGR